MSAEVHVTLPAFSRLCLICNSCGAAPAPAGGLDALLTDAATLAELRHRLAGSAREQSLVSGVCAPCRGRLLRCQRHLVDFRAAADALGAAYGAAAAARRRSGVRLRRGGQQSEVPYTACCDLAAGGALDLGGLVRQLVASVFGPEALDGTIIVSSPPAEGAEAEDGGRQETEAEGSADSVRESEDTVDGDRGPGNALDANRESRAMVAVRELEDAADASRKFEGGEDVDRESGSTMNDKRVLSESEGSVLMDAARTSSERTSPSPNSSNETAISTIAAETRAEYRPAQGSAASESAPVKEEAEDDDGDEEESRQERRDRDWSAGRWSRRVRSRAAAAAPRADHLSQPGHPPDAPLPPPPSENNNVVAVRRRGRPPRDAPDGRFCHMCRQSFRSERSLQLHVERLHRLASAESSEEAVRVWCPACSALLPPDDVTGHVTDQHGGRLECSCCDVTVQGAAAAALHCADKHTANYMCIVCLQMYSSQDQLIGHMNTSHDASPADADADRPDAFDPVATVYNDLVRRLRCRARRLQFSVLGRTAVRCPYCAQTCSLHYLRTHLYKHKSAGFRCHACEKRFKFPVSFQKHLLLHAGRADKCPHCDAVFSGRSNLLSHLRTHSTDRQFACERCHKRFKFKQTRDAHVRRAHGGGAAKVCDVCGAEFRLQYQLTVHLARHRNGRTIRCPLCPRLYELNLDLKRHLYSKHKLKVAEAERRFPEIRRRPNTMLEASAAAAADAEADADVDADADADADDPRDEPLSASAPGSSAYPSAAAAAAAADYLSADDPPAADGFLAAAAADEGAAQLEVSRIITVPADLLSGEPLQALDAMDPLDAGGAVAAAAAAGQMLLLVDGADVGMLMRDVLPASSAAF